MRILAGMMGESIVGTLITDVNSNAVNGRSVPKPTIEGTAKPLDGTSYRVLPATRAAVRHLIRRHYLKSWPGVTVATLGLFHEWNPVGVMVFALGPRETERRYGATCWELARLYLLDELPKNSESWFIARGIRWVRSNHPEVKCLVSYADPAAFHTGTIYRASNWIEDGRTDDDRKTPRFDYQIPSISLFGSLGLRISRRSHIPEHVIDFERLRRVSKYRFVYWLDGSHERRRQTAQFLRSTVAVSS